MNKLINDVKTFEGIKHTDEHGNEYWYARELQKALEYVEWRKFEKVIGKSKQACLNSNNKVDDHFVQVDKMVKTGDSMRKVNEYKLSRYACYLIVQNGDSRKKVISTGQTYFAIQTRKQEISELKYNELSEDEKRYYQRRRVRKWNYVLNKTASKAGVKNFDKFHNAGYKGLYDGETANDIARRKKLRYREDILDNMGSDELAANLFRISLTNQKLINENIRGEKNSSDAHYGVGVAVRNTIKKVGGTLPEDLPTPDKSLKSLEKEIKKEKALEENENYCSSFFYIFVIKYLQEMGDVLWIKL